MNQWTRRKLALKKESQSREDLTAELLVDAALFHAEADIRWLELCKAKISEAGRTAGETRWKTVFLNHDPAAAGSGVVAISSSSSIFLPLFSVVENIAMPLLLDGLPQSLFNRYAMNALLRH